MFITAGRKAAQFIARTKRKLAAEFTYKDTPAVHRSPRHLASSPSEMFLNGEVDQVDVLFTNFVNTLTQKPDVRAVAADRRDQRSRRPASNGAAKRRAAREPPIEFLFEPDAEQVLGALLPHYLNFQIYQMLLEAKATEHSARMVAMKNATDNAKQLIKDLTLEYNKMRQASITKELLEITTAADGAGLNRH